MSQPQEALTQCREAFRRELAKRGSTASFLIIGAVVSVVNLVIAYHRKSISDAIIVVVLWMIFFPLLGRWMYWKKQG
jgi:hypothetical protein